MIHPMQQYQPTCYKCNCAHGHHYRKRFLRNEIVCICDICKQPIFVAKSPFQTQSVTKDAIQQMNTDYRYDDAVALRFLKPILRYV